MHLLPAFRRRDIQTLLDAQPIPETPREIAVEWIREKVKAGKAGLDPYDPSVFVLAAGANERTWAYRSLELTGIVVSRTVQDGGERFRAHLEADVRMELRLDLDGCWMTDEPLASRSVESTLTHLTLAQLDPERESTAAIRRAFDAFERTVH